MRRLPLLFLFALSLFPAAAQVMQEVSVDQVRTLLNDLKIKFEEKQQENSTFFDFELEDYDLTLFRYKDSLMLQTHFSDKLKLEDANNWNQIAQFGRVYLDKDGRPFVEADLRFEGGVTKVALEAFVKRFPEVIDSFVDSLEGPGEKDTADLPVRTKPESSITKYDLQYGNFTLWYDSQKWRPQNASAEGRREFQHVNGQGFAVVISEGIPFPLDSFEEIAMENAQKSDPAAKLLSKEHRMVNGKEVLALQFQTTRAGVLFKFYGYYTSSPSGSAQVVTYTADSVFGANEADFAALLDGLTVR